MTKLYNYKVTKQAQAFQVPEEGDIFWSSPMVCFKFTYCPRLILKDGKVFLGSAVHSTLQAEIGDYLVYQNNELFFVKKKVFELRYEEADN